MTDTTGKIIRLRRRLFPFAFLALICTFLFGMIGVFAISEIPEAAIPIGLIMGPPGLFLLILGVTLSRLLVRCDGTVEPARIAFRLSRAGLAPIFPWWLHFRDIAVTEISRIDVVLRPNQGALGGVERLYHLRTNQGDFCFNSVSFSNWNEFDAFAREQGIMMNIGTPAQIMDADAGMVRPSMLETSMRGCGWIFFAILLIMIALGGIVAVFGDPEARAGGMKAVFMAALGLAAVPFMTRYRRVK